MDLKITYSNWQVVLNKHYKQKLFHALIILTSSGGKKILQDIYSSAVLSKKEEVENSYKGKLKDCVIAKENHAISALKAYAESFLEKRMGVCGYRGYFKFVKVENANIRV